MGWNPDAPVGLVLSNEGSKVKVKWDEYTVDTNGGSPITEFSVKVFV